MPIYSSYNSLGSSIDETELEDGAVTINKLDSNILREQLIETITFTADSTKTSADMSALNYDYFRIIIDLTASTTAINGRFRINGLDGNVYNRHSMNNTAVQLSTGQNNFAVSTSDSGYETQRINQNFTITSTSQAVTNGKWIIFGLGTDTRQFATQMGWVVDATVGGNTRVTTVTFYTLDSGTFNGTIKVYGGYYD
jgi:hypothetical protein